MEDHGPARRLDAATQVTPVVAARANGSRMSLPGFDQPAKEIAQLHLHAALAVERVESDFVPRTVGSFGTIGLMRILPATVAR